MALKKAQLSVELILLLIVLLGLFLPAYVLVQERSSQLSQQQILLRAKIIADDLASHINAVYLAGPGTNISLLYPSTLEGNLSYTLQVYPLSRVVLLQWTIDGHSHRYTAPLLTSNVTSLPLRQSINLKNIAGGVSLDS